MAATRLGVKTNLDWLRSRPIRWVKHMGEVLYMYVGHVVWQQMEMMLKDTDGMDGRQHILSSVVHNYVTYHVTKSSQHMRILDDFEHVWDTFCHYLQCAPDHILYAKPYMPNKGQKRIVFLCSV